MLRAHRLAAAIEESGLKLSQSVQYWYCFGTNIVAISGNQPTLLFGIVMRFALKVAPWESGDFYFSVLSDFVVT